MTPYLMSTGDVIWLVATVVLLAVALKVGCYLESKAIEREYHTFCHTRNTYQSVRDQRNDAVTLARSFGLPAAKGWRAKQVVDITEARRRHLRVVAITGSRMVH